MGHVFCDRGISKAKALLWQRLMSQQIDWCSSKSPKYSLHKYCITQYCIFCIQMRFVHCFAGYLWALAESSQDHWQFWCSSSTSWARRSYCLWANCHRRLQSSFQNRLFLQQHRHALSCTRRWPYWICPTRFICAWWSPDFQKSRNQASTS